MTQATAGLTSKRKLGIHLSFSSSKAWRNAMSLRMSLSVCKNEYRYVVIQPPKAGPPPDAALSYPLASNHRLSASEIDDLYFCLVFVSVSAASP